MKRLFFIISVVLSLGFTNSFNTEEVITGAFQWEWEHLEYERFTNVYTAYGGKEKLNSKVLKYSIEKRTSLDFDPEIYEIHLSELDSILINHNHEGKREDSVFYLKTGKTINFRNTYNSLYFKKDGKNTVKAGIWYFKKIKFNN
jgi:hypothetical protein